MLSHVSSLRLPLVHSGLVFTLSSAAQAYLLSPCLLVVDMSIWATSLIGVVVRPVICGFYLFIFSSQLCCPLRFQNSHRPASCRVSWYLETSLSRLPPWDWSPSLTLLSLFLSFIFCHTFFQREWAGFLGPWCPQPPFRSCFVEFSQC